MTSLQNSAAQAAAPVGVSPRTFRRQYYFVQGLTLIRAPLIFLFLLATILPAKPLPTLWFVIGFTCMVLSAVSDLFDGYFARKFGVTSRLGSYADPFTDKIFYLTAFPTLVYLAARRGQLEHACILLVLTIVFLLRDQWVSLLRSLGALHNLNAKANWSGKARTIISFPSICVIYYFLEAPISWPLRFQKGTIYGLEAISLLINFVSIYVYTREFWPAMSKEMRPPEQMDKR